MKVCPTSGGWSVEMTAFVPLVQALLAAAVALPGTVGAQPCRIEATGGASAEWLAATDALADLALTDQDCVRVQIDIADEHARVVFVAPDGRVAERIVTAATELRPTIDALRVQGPAPAEPTPKESTAAPVVAPEVAASPTRATSASSDLRLALLAGLRGGPESLISPLLIGEVAIGISLFELGASLGAEIQYVDVSGARSPERQGSAAVLGVHAGARVPSGAFDVRAGARFAFAPLLTINNDTQACPVGQMCSFPEYDERTSEWRLGAYAGFAVPRTSALRFRAELAADLVTPAASDAELAITPPWALAAQLGLEVAP